MEDDDGSGVKVVDSWKYSEGISDRIFWMDVIYCIREIKESRDYEAIGLAVGRMELPFNVVR